MDELPVDAKLDFQELAKRAQSMLSERPVVVLGTGASIPHGLPSMRTLADELVATVRDDLPGWVEFSQRLDETKDLEQALHDVALPAETVEELVRATWDIVTATDLRFYKELLSGTAAFPLADVFRHLLRTADSQLRVVTTNYDRLAEYAANRVGAYVSTGVTAGWLQRFLPATVENERPPAPGYEGLVTVLKVHGSLDWFRDAIDDAVGVPLSRTIPSDMQPLIVTPGVSKYKESHKDPFRSVLSTADAALRKATCYLCVGYGFNDEHVQPVLVSRVKKDQVPLLVVTKSLTPHTRTTFLEDPPKRFLFIEKGTGGSMVYSADYPDGELLLDTDVWQLDEFMKMVTATGGQ